MYIISISEHMQNMIKILGKDSLLYWSKVIFQIVKIAPIVVYPIGYQNMDASIGMQYIFAGDLAIYVTVRANVSLSSFLSN